MKVIKQGNYNNAFPMEIECKRITDKYGFGYEDAKDYCGSLLEVVESDIKKHKWSKYPDYSGTDYGIICPVCGNFIVIEESKIPKNTLEQAEEIFLNK